MNELSMVVGFAVLGVLTVGAMVGAVLGVIGRQGRSLDAPRARR